MSFLLINKDLNSFFSEKKKVIVFSKYVEVGGDLKTQLLSQLKHYMFAIFYFGLNFLSL